MTWECALWRCGAAEKPLFPWYSPKVCVPRSVNVMPEQAIKSRNGARHQHLAGTSQACHPETDVDGDADKALFFVLDLARVHPNPHLDPEFLQGLANGTGATDCAGRAYRRSRRSRLRLSPPRGLRHGRSSLRTSTLCSTKTSRQWRSPSSTRRSVAPAMSVIRTVSQHPCPLGARPQPCAGIEGLQGREVGRQARDEELEDAFRARQALQTVFAEVSQAQLIEQGILDDRGRRRGEQHLPAMASLFDPRAADDVQPRIPFVVRMGSPVWMPMRTRTAPPCGHDAVARARWICTAAATAWVARRNTTKNESPWVSTSQPSYAVKAARSRVRCVSSTAGYCSRRCRAKGGAILDVGVEHREGATG